MERRKYDKFLVRDKEKLQYINQMMNTKRLVEMSYINEVGRVKAQMELDAQLESEASRHSLIEASKQEKPKKLKTKRVAVLPTESRLYKSIKSMQAKER